MIILFFEVACTSYKKKHKNKYKEKWVILQLIDIIAIKSKETRVVTYTGRYSAFKTREGSLEEPLKESAAT